MTLAVKDATGAIQNIPFPNSNGQEPMAASAPVVIASDQVVPISVVALPLPAGAAADGSDGAGITAPAGGAGIRGWLSGIYSRLSSPLSVTGVFWQATQPVSGTVSVANLPGTQVVSGTVAAKLQDNTGAAFGTVGNPVYVSGGGSGGGGAVTMADGANITEGAKADAAYTDSTGAAAGSLVALLKGLFTKLGSPLQAGGSVAVSNLPATQAVSGSVTISGAISNSSFGIAGTLPAFTATPTVNIGSAPAIAVTGTFWQATQPVSLAALPALSAGTSLIGAVNLDIGGAALSPANPVPVIDAYTAPSASVWTSATASNTAVSVVTGGYDTVIVTLVGNGSLAGGIAAFEAFDGAAWILIKAASISDYTTSAGAVLGANMSVGYQVPVAGFPQFRVRLAGSITAGSLTVTTITSSAPDTSVVTVGLDPAQPLPAGTKTIGTVLGPLPASPITGQQTLTTAAVALPANALQNGLIVTALSANTGTVYVGAAGVSTSTGYPLNAGQSMSFAVANAGGIAIIGTNATDKIAFAGN